MTKPKKKSLLSHGKKGPKFTPRQRLMIGLEFMFSNDPNIADTLAQKYNCCRSHIYNCREVAEEVLDRITDDMITGEFFVLITIMINALILVLTLACHASIEGIQLFFVMIFGMHISIGKISQTITDCSKQAENIVQTADYSNVNTIASDEIYMSQDQPILVTIDPHSTAVLMIKPEEKLSAEMWAADLKEVQSYSGLNPQVAVNDSGAALMKGIPMAFEGIEIQPDIFHTEMDLGYETAKFTNYAESLINEEFKAEQSVSGQKVHKKTVEKLTNIRAEMDEVLPIADKVIETYELIRKDFGFTGCPSSKAVKTASEKLDLLLDAIPSINDEVNRICINSEGFESLSEQKKKKKMEETKALLSGSRKWKRYNSLRAAIHRLQKRIEKEGIFGFLRRLEEEFGKLKEELDVPYEYIFDAYQVCVLKNRQEYYEAYDQLFEKYWMIGREDCLDEVMSAIHFMISKTVRSSSLVENTNHKIRPYIEMKKTLTPSFCCLLQLFLNTKPYRRSIKGRAGKTPLELLTGLPSPPLLDMLDLS